jgi:hypothetical protein
MDISKQIDKKGGTIGKNIVALKQKLIELVDKSGKTRKNIDKECGFRATNYLTLPKKDKKPDPWVNILPTDDKWNKIKEVLGVGDEFDDIFVSAKREVIGIQTKARSENSSFTMPTMGDITEYKSWDITAPATDLAKKWEGWGTALKPAHEPIVMARKPLSENTVVDNVLEWGTGGINIDESRIPFKDEADRKESTQKNQHADFGTKPLTGNVIYGDYSMVEPKNYNPPGRLPANIIFDEEAGKLLDEQSGISKSTGGRNGNKEGVGHNGMYGKYNGQVKDGNPGLGDVGGASRFFYCPKASKKDRNEGLEHLPISRPDERTETGMGSFVDKGIQPQQNIHPTVKPTDLMLYLIRLVTPKGGTTLDPFMGSGSTGKAAVRGGFDFVGIEREKDYFQIAEARIQYEIDNPYIEGKDERIQLNKTAKNFW